MTREPAVVSVVIPAYNAERYIERALVSCLCQTHVELEVLVVDDGSVDKTTDIVKSLAADPRVQLIELGANGGVSNARNAALDRATGTWIAPLDADDAMTEDRIALLVAEAERTGADLVHDDLLLLRDGEEFPFATLTESTGGRIDPTIAVDLDELIDCEVGGRSSYRLGLTRPLIRRSFIETNTIRYDPALRVGEDYRFYMECVLAGATWVQIPGAHYVYVQRDGSATSSAQVPALEAKLRACAELVRRPQLDSAQRVSLLRYYRNLRSLLAYQRVVEPAKAGHVGSTLAAALQNPRFARRMGTELPAVVKRRWAYHVRHDEHAFDMLSDSSP